MVYILPIHLEWIEQIAQYMLQQSVSFKLMNTNKIRKIKWARDDMLTGLAPPPALTRKNTPMCGI